MTAREAERIGGRLNLKGTPWCKTHESYDTNHDGLCIVYGTSRPEVRERIGQCELLPPGSRYRVD